MSNIIKGNYETLLSQISEAKSDGVNYRVFFREIIRP